MEAAPTITTEHIQRLVPFAAFLGVTFTRLDHDRVVAVLAARDGLTTVGGSVHGGAQMALADIAAAVLAVLADGDPSAAPATVQSSTSFLVPAHGELTATATVVRRARTNVVDVTVVDETGATVSVVRQLIAVRRTGG